MSLGKNDSEKKWFEFGSHNATFWFAFVLQKKSVQCVLTVKTNSFEELQLEKENYEKLFGNELQWEPESEYNRIRYIQEDIDGLDSSLKDDYFQWYIETAQKFNNAFGNLEKMEVFRKMNLPAPKVRFKGSSDGTMTNHRHCLHGIFNRVKRPLGLQVNPFEDVQAPFRPKRDAHRCFTSEELKRLLEAVSPEWKMLITLAFYTGLRFGDCCQFLLEFIEWDKNIIRITPEKTERFNKELIIPLHPALGKAFKDYTNALQGYLVPEFAERQSKQLRGFNAEFGILLRGLGFKKKTSEGILDFHSLRHTFNTMLANGGIDVSTRMKLTGHSSVEVNQIYNHAIEPLRDAIKCIPVLE